MNRRMNRRNARNGDTQLQKHDTAAGSEPVEPVYSFLRVLRVLRYTPSPHLSLPGFFGKNVARGLAGLVAVAYYKL
jgi:hypothetical protein